MKLLHTSDWHLGKRLDGKSRLPEQRDALERLVRICDEENIDVILVAGDIFDTFNPPAEAEELFYSYAVRLAAGRHLVAVAGNHDNAERLAAPADIARYCNIILAGGMDNTRYTRGEVTGGEGFVRICRGGETLNLALLPYPSAARMSALGYKQGDDSYETAVRDWLSRCAACFTSEGTNVLCSHLYMLGAQKSDESELGSASLLPASVLPQADYVALGHIHKRQKIAGHNAYYSGSLLRYSFDDTTDKFFTVVDCAGKNCSVRTLPVGAGKIPVRATVHSFDEAVAALAANPDAWVQILYDCAKPLSAARYAQLRSFDNFCSLNNIYRAQSKTSGAPRVMRTDTELFREFFERETGEKPSESLTELFLRAVNGEEI